MSHSQAYAEANMTAMYTSLNDRYSMLWSFHAAMNRNHVQNTIWSVEKYSESINAF
jgi:hypothetical protein